MPLNHHTYVSHYQYHLGGKKTSPASVCIRSLAMDSKKSTKAFREPAAKTVPRYLGTSMRGRSPKTPTSSSGISWRTIWTIINHLEIGNGFETKSRQPWRACTKFTALGVCLKLGHLKMSWFFMVYHNFPQSKRFHKQVPGDAASQPAVPAKSQVSGGSVGRPLPTKSCLGKCQDSMGKWWKMWHPFDISVICEDCADHQMRPLLLLVFKSNSKIT